MASPDADADADDELARVTRLLKEAGCATVDGCHELGRDRAEVHFRTAEDAMEFLNAMAAYGLEPHTADVPAAAADNTFPEALYARMTGCGSPGDWAYAVEPEGWAPEEAPEGDEPVDDVADLFPLAVSVRFPRADLPLVRERLARAVQDPRRPAGPNGVLD
jgi:hypothetical protein